MGLPMPKQKFLWFLLMTLALAAIVLGADAIYLYTHPVVSVEWSTASGAINRNAPIQVKVEIGGIPERAVAGLMVVMAGTILGVLLRNYRRRMQNVV